MSNLSLWVEVYRPSTLDGYVFKNAKMEAQIRSWLDNTEKKRIPIPHILLTGAAGTGKTTLARIICNQLGVEKNDIMEINASRENNVEFVRSKIVNFCSTWASGDYKIVFLDEFDGFGEQAQKILRGEMEKYHESVRFIATGNYANKIIPALVSRFQHFHFDTLDTGSYIERLADVLEKENVDYDPDDLMKYYSLAYPDLRKGINLLEQHVRGNKLYPIEEESASKDYLIEMTILFKDKKYTEARKLVCSQARTEDYEAIYRFLYTNLDLFSEDESVQSQAVIFIAQGLRNHGLSADPEINLAATMCQLSNLS